MDSGKEVTPYSRCPRRVATAAEAYVRSHIKGAETMFGPEFEFYVFDSVEYRQEPGLAFYEIKSAEAGGLDAHGSDHRGHRIGYSRAITRHPRLTERTICAPRSQCCSNRRESV